MTHDPAVNPTTPCPPAVSPETAGRLRELGVQLLRINADRSIHPLTPDAEPWADALSVLHTSLFAEPVTALDDGQLHAVWLDPQADPESDRCVALVRTPDPAAAQTIARAAAFLLEDQGAPQKPTLSQHGPAPQDAKAHAPRDESDLRKRHREVTRELAATYEELSLLHRFAIRLKADASPAPLLEEATGELQQTLQLRWLCLHLGPEAQHLPGVHTNLYSAGQAPGPGPLRQAGDALLKHFGLANQALILDRPQRVAIPDHLLGAREPLVVAPLRRDGQPLGLLFGAGKLDGSGLTSIDAKLLDALAASLTIFLHNAELVGDARDLFAGALHALTTAIDAKDTYTLGHSNRVALLARAIAVAAGHDRESIKRAHLAALVHDIGKIGVPEAILTKPAPLDPEETRIVQQHPVIGARILQSIRPMRELIPGVLHHHERWDGNGYPHQLTGPQTPQLGRVLALADAFDAMCSNRAYRRAFDETRAREEILRCRGTQFDPELVDAFQDVDLVPYAALIDQHLAADERPHAA
ncbi:MAG: HD domain-containing phosphohydrolase [Planctomycetota bacterium]